MSPSHKSSPAPARPAFQQWAMSPSHLSVSVMQWLLLIIYYLKDKDQRSRLRQIKAIVCLKLTHLLTTLFIYNLQPTCETWNNHTCIQESLWQSLRPFGARILSVLAEWIILCLVGRRQSYIKSKLQQCSNTLGLVGYSTTIHTLPSYLSSNNKAIMALSLLSVLCIKMQILTLLRRSNTFLSFANNMQHLRAVMELVVKSLTLEFLKAWCHQMLKWVKSEILLLLWHLTHLSASSATNLNIDTHPAHQHLTLKGDQNTFQDHLHPHLMFVFELIIVASALLVILGSEDQELGNGFSRNIVLVLTWQQNILQSTEQSNILWWAVKYSRWCSGLEFLINISLHNNFSIDTGLLHAPKHS